MARSKQTSRTKAPARKSTNGKRTTQKKNKGGEKSNKTSPSKPSALAPTVSKSKRKFRPGTRTKMNIKRAQRSTKSVTPFAPLVRLVRSIVSNDLKEDNIRFQENTLRTLHYVTEAYCTHMIRRGWAVTEARSKKTLCADNMETAQKIIEM